MGGILSPVGKQLGIDPGDAWIWWWAVETIPSRWLETLTTISSPEQGLGGQAGGLMRLELYGLKFLWRGEERTSMEQL